MNLLNLSSENEIFWKLLVDTSTDWLLIEKRNLQTLQTSFDVLDLHSQEFILKDMQLWESWWLSAAWIHQKKIVFSLYEQEGSPIGKGIIVYDIATRNILWQNLDLNFFGADRQQNCVFLRKNLGNIQAQAYDLHTGQQKQEQLQKNDENLLGYNWASVYNPENRFYKDLQTFIHQKTQQMALLPIHYAETPNYICMVYGIEFEEKFAYFLLITDIAGNIEIYEKIGTKPNVSFFVYGSYLIVFHTKEIRLYFLKNKTL
ncbi:MAG: DUF4905 domain-containing protein [Raineya sp.]